MITKAQAMRAPAFTSTHVLSRARSNPQLIGVRANGKCKTWKTRPDDFQVPVKYGRRECFYITNRNAHEWTCAVKEFAPFDPAWRTKDVVDIAKEIKENTSSGTFDPVLFKKWREDKKATCLALADALHEAGADGPRIEEAEAGHLRPDSALIREILNM